MNWDHLRYFLELARSGTLAGAARRLDVNHATVARRLQSLEKQVGATLFTRAADGHHLTESGRQLLRAAQDMERAARTATLHEGKTPAGPSGVVRLGTTEGFGSVMLAPQLAALTQRHPALTLDVLALPRLVHLSRREADIVVSLERPRRESVIVTRLTDYALYLYGQDAYVARHAPIQRPEELRAHPFVSYVDDLLFSDQLQFLDGLCRPARFTLRSTSIGAQVQAVRAGAGLAVLPAFMADRHPELVRVLPQRARFVRTFWMSIPGELRDEPAIRTVWQFMRDAVAAMQPRLLPGA